MTVICTFFVCMIGNVSVEAKTVTKDITIGKGKHMPLSRLLAERQHLRLATKKDCCNKEWKNHRKIDWKS